MAEIKTKKAAAKITPEVSAADLALDPAMQAAAKITNPNPDEVRKSLETAPVADGGKVFVYSKVKSGHMFLVAGDMNATHPKDRVRAKVYLRPAPRGNTGDLSAGKYSVTEVDGSLWAEVERQHWASPHLKNNVIFTAETREKGDAMARDFSGYVKLGREPLTLEDLEAPQDTREEAIEKMVN